MTNQKQMIIPVSGVTSQKAEISPVSIAGRGDILSVTVVLIKWDALLFSPPLAQPRGREMVRASRNREAIFKYRYFRS